MTRSKTVVPWHHFDAEGFVSIWVCEKPLKDVPDDYFAEKYGREDDEPLAQWMGEFGFGWFDHDFMDTNGHSPALGPLRDLIAPCSYAISFVNAAVREAEWQDVAGVSFVLLLYDFRYDPAVTGVTQGKYLRFLWGISIQEHDARRVTLNASTNLTVRRGV